MSREGAQTWDMWPSWLPTQRLVPKPLCPGSNEPLGWQSTLGLPFPGEAPSLQLMIRQLMTSHRLIQDIHNICRLPTGIIMDFYITATLGGEGVATTVTRFQIN